MSNVYNEFVWKWHVNNTCQYVLLTCYQQNFMNILIIKYLNILYIPNIFAKFSMYYVL